MPGKTKRGSNVYLEVRREAAQPIQQWRSEPTSWR